MKGLHWSVVACQNGPVQPRLTQAPGHRPAELVAAGDGIAVPALASFVHAAVDAVIPQGWCGSMDCDSRAAIEHLQRPTGQGVHPQRPRSQQKVLREDGLTDLLHWAYIAFAGCCRKCCRLDGAARMTDNLRG